MVANGRTVARRDQDIASRPSGTRAGRPAFRPRGPCRPLARLGALAARVGELVGRRVFDDEARGTRLLAPQVAGVQR